MKRLIWLIVLFGLLALGVACLLITRRTCRPTQTLCEFDIQQLAGALRTYGWRFGKMPDLQPNGNGRDVHVQVLKLLTGANNTNGPIFLDMGNRRLVEGQFLDPWGNPYHICVATNHGGSTTIGKFAVAESFAVWSSGPNGSNEYGMGDDVRSWTNLTLDRSGTDK